MFERAQFSRTHVVFRCLANYDTIVNPELARLSNYSTTKWIGCRGVDSNQRYLDDVKPFVELIDFRPILVHSDLSLKKDFRNA